MKNIIVEINECIWNNFAVLTRIYKLNIVLLQSENKGIVFEVKVFIFN